MRSKWILSLFFLLLLTGCYDKTEVEHGGYVTVIGLDKAKKEEVDVTFQITNVEVGGMAQGEGGKEKASEIISLESNDFLTARTMANASVTRELNFNYLIAIIVSEEFAKTDEFLNIIQIAMREREMRREITLIISKEKAKKFIKDNKPQMETRPGEYYKFIIDKATKIGFVPEASLNRFFQMTSGKADLALGMYVSAEKPKQVTISDEDEFKAGQLKTEGGNPAQFLGSAVFKEGKMIGLLNGEETRFASLFDNTVSTGELLLTYPDPKDKAFRVLTKYKKVEPTKVDVKIKNGKTKIDVKLPVNLEIVGIPSSIDYSTNRKNKKLLENHIEKEIEEKAKKFVKRTQEEFKGEPFYWSLYARKEFLTIQDYEKAEWMDKLYPNADVNIDVDVTITKFGRLIQDNKIREVRD